MYKIAVIGGTGPQGKGLAWRFAAAGHDVVIGSRTVERAGETASVLRDRLSADPTPGAGVVSAAENHDACLAAELVLLAVPYDGHDELVASLPLEDKIVISCVNPLAFDKDGPRGRPVDGGEGSAAESAARIAPAARIVGAFHHVSAIELWKSRPCLGDVLVVGDSVGAKEVVVELAASVTGRPGIDAGKLRMARQLEPLTAVLISINERYKIHSSFSVAGFEFAASAGAHLSRSSR